MAKKKVVDVTREILQGFLTENGYELYHLEFLKEGKEKFLRVYIDKISQEDTAYVSTDDCEKVSRFLSSALDSQDLIEDNYYLEVSSPGLDRSLNKKEDYVRFAGSQVEVSLYKNFNGVKKVEGKLIELRENELVIGLDKGTIEIPMEYVAGTKLAVIF